MGVELNNTNEYLEPKDAYGAGKEYAGYYITELCEKRDIAYQKDISITNQESYIGKPDLGHKVGYPKASGTGKYTRDIAITGMLYAKSMYCPYPHAKIKSMDLSVIDGMPGVRGIIKYGDPDLEGYLCASFGGGVMPNILDDTAQWNNQPLGFAVCADTEEICDEAIRKVAKTVDWELLPVEMDWEEAWEDNVIVNPEIPGLETTNRYSHYEEEWGDLEAGFEEADHIIEERQDFEEDTAAHVQAATNVSYMHGDELFFWYSNQDGGWNLQTASLREVPRGKMHIFMPLTGIQAVGGGNAFAHLYSERIGYLFCKRLGRPVYCSMERTHWHGGEWTNGIYGNKIGFKDDGQITAIEADSLQVRNAFETVMSIVKSTAITNFQETRRMSNTSRGPAVCYRDGAEVECEFNEVFAKVAAFLGVDQATIALHPLNDGADGIPYDSDDDRAFRAKHFLYPDRHSLKEIIDMGKADMDWDSKWHQAGTKTMADIYPDRPWDKRKHGMNMNHANEWTQMHRPSHVHLGIECDGSVVMHGQHTDQGCGDFVPYACIVADELGAKYEDVGWKGKYSNETGYQFMDPGGATNLCANAPQLARAAKKAKDMFLSLATLKSYRGNPLKNTREVYPTQPALFEGLSWDELDTKDSLVFEKANPSNSKTFKEVAEHHSQGGSWRNTSREPVAVDDYGGPIDWRRVHEFQAHFIEVAVDEETGKCEIIKAAIINDVGKVINPEGCWGQQYGGAHGMGFGGSNFERLYYDPPSGIVLNDNHEGYKITLFNDIGPISCGLLESQQGWSAYGAAGIGEDIGAVTRSITNAAVYNATGKWVNHHPTTPDMVLKSLGKG